MTPSTLTLLPAPQIPAETDAPGAVELVTNAGEFGYFNLVDIRISKTNRKRFSQAKLDELAASVKAKGVAQPILLRPVEPTADEPQKYEIVAGERRFRASIIAGLPTIPAMLRTLTDVEALELQILENLQRDDPHPLEEAEGYERLMLERNYDVDQLADKLSKSRSYVYGRLKLCALTTSVREQFLEDKFSAATALLIARIPNPALQVRAAKEVCETDYWGEPRSYRAQRDLLRQRFMLDLKSAVFAIKDAALLADVGTCVECPKRSGNQQEAFEGEKHENLCTDPDCFAEKTAAHSKKAKQKAEDRGHSVISGAEAKKIMPNSYGNLKGGYADVDREFYVSGSGSTSYRKILGKLTPKGVLLESPFEPGKLITIAKIDELEDLVTTVAGSGKTEASASAKQKAQEKQQEQAAAVEKRFRRELFVAIRDASRVESTPINEQEVAALLFRNSPGSEENFIRKLYGWTGPEFESGTWDGKYIHSSTRIGDAIRALSADDARQLIRDMTLIRELEVSTYSFNKADQPELMLAAAVNLGIDVNTMKKAIVGEAKKLAAEKAAKKAKAADKAMKKGPAQALLPEVEQPAETAPAAVVDAPIGAASADVRYRHPNSMMTWTGRGRAPKWVQEWIESGNTLDGVQVHATPAATNQASAQVMQ
ncbi:ParB/RepB/Spo0J family partition protein [Massilia sp. CFBP9026]|uniref:ParB/RepB/Spo0J family partition protein n=1 Tax=Massilia sp. CFBP9026 TaxID=3096536 RepID=UPI002A6AFB55|nr:ParB/RepB/Spo0J family partition protein [Massilia sp. CFBP9026]MDY0965403.1 ParB/RepB/Spo0J family partition protein [Massilia sp. CFBP9026]